MAPSGTITVTVMLDSPGNYYDFYVDTRDYYIHILTAWIILNLDTCN